MNKLHWTTRWQPDLIVLSVEIVNLKKKFNKWNGNEILKRYFFCFTSCLCAVWTLKYYSFIEFYSHMAWLWAWVNPIIISSSLFHACTHFSTAHWCICRFLVVIQSYSRHIITNYPTNKAWRNTVMHILPSHHTPRACLYLDEENSWIFIDREIYTPQKWVSSAPIMDRHLKMRIPVFFCQMLQELGTCISQ